MPAGSPGNCISLRSLGCSLFFALLIITLSEQSLHANPGNRAVARTRSQHGADTPTYGAVKTAVEVFRQASKSVVAIYNYGDSGTLQSLGSGIVLPSGDVATNYHVIEKAGRLTVIYQGKEYPAKPRYIDRFRDVCSLDAPGLQALHVRLGSTKILNVGAKVYAIGSPKGLELTFSDGLISRLREVDKGYYIQTTAPISVGSSGGGLFDENGRLIGLPTYFLNQGQQLNFALPVEWITDLPNRHAIQAKANGVETEWLNKVNTEEEQQDWGSLLDICKRWSAALPQNCSAWRYLGFAYIQNGDLPMAIAAYQEAVRINPGDAHYWSDLGAAYGRAGQQANKIAAYEQAVTIDPDSENSWINLGVAYLDNGNSEKSISAYQQAVRIAPDNVGSWTQLGIIYGRNDQKEKQIDAFRKAVRINPDYSNAWLNLGSAFQNTGQFAKAIEAYQQAVRINPENSDAWIKLGFSYRDATQLSKALESYQQAVKINPQNSNAWVCLGVAHGMAYNETEELAAYQEALRVNPENNIALFNLGHDYLEHGNQNKSLEVYYRLKLVKPELATIFFNDFNHLFYPNIPH
ncbi:MAG: tetratricopeptide repeat protein [Chlorobiaceae bacterium]|nr:tetratricopeptide repeat protein [Chlorobiaceae bacterium]